MSGGLIKVKIAICDDENKFLTKIKEDLSSLQSYENEFSFDEFKTGRELLADFSEGKYALVILDIEMPGLNGLETAEFLRKIDDKVIIIFLTGYEKFACQGYAVRAFRYILKNQPLAVICGHIHEGIGVEKIGETTVINPGSLGEGNYAWLEIEKKVDCWTVVRTELCKL